MWYFWTGQFLALETVAFCGLEAGVGVGQNWDSTGYLHNYMLTMETLLPFKSLQSMLEGFGKCHNKQQPVSLFSVHSFQSYQFQAFPTADHAHTTK